MRATRPFAACALGLLCLLLAALLPRETALGARPLVVVNPGVDASNLSLNALRAMFGMRLPKWQDGTPVRVFVLSDEDPLHVAFSKQVLGVFPHQLRLAWDRLVFSGTGQAPTEVHSQAEMRERVANTPGAIGYLDEAMIDDSVRVLPIHP